MKADDWLLNLCVPELRVADVIFNTARILEILRHTASSSDRKQLCLFPQLALSGNTCADLFLQPLLAQACLLALEQIEDAIDGSNLVVVLGLPLSLENQLYDATAVIEPGGLRGFVLNQQPDPRYFQSPKVNTPNNLSWRGSVVKIFEHGRLNLSSLGLQNMQIVLGDLPEGRLFAEEMLLFNLTALPALADSTYDTKFHQFSSQNAGLLAVCSAGASESTGENVFSGLCQVWQNGNLLAEDFELGFQSKLLQLDLHAVENGLDSLRSADSPHVVRRGLDSLRSANSPPPERDPHVPFLLADNQNKQLETAFEIQTAGLMGRIRHTKSENLLLGISGGADSSMALLVCCHALDQLGIPRENLIAVSMPGPGSSDKSLKNSDDLTNLTGIKPRVISIEAALTEHLANIGHDWHTPDVTYENAQARERTQILMNLANLHNGLVVGTGDMSENALGWSTYNGDQMSMYNVNAGLPKTVLLKLLVWAAAMLFGEQGRQVAQTIADAPISAELKPLLADGSISQATEDVLGPYRLHDFFLWHALQERKNPAAVFTEATHIFAGEYEPGFILQTLKTFYQRFFRHQFKRTASPDGPRLFSLALSPRSGWRMPADASPSLWLEQLHQIENTLRISDNSQ
ncbi:MAG: NAD(+) synthase [Anaerolineaceae bacterium]|nr:NAD(+) synthase [Anaerolineaceae bacterium]MDD4043319.1 NAD(+) synthase [Anaerolineaceae bacterium]MDD4577765.1 NAD(+) synthase [Anaerolineaceae bacterium]